ncbi:hypothetical protein QJS10_CPB18g01810 [Acorus calamus]|uniref:RNase H type-1 domain-containing protein n=1 Tax=Acorus calamus TaxID=4465 RepID=A0AAV9CPL5_ACOCL|nr:hypothetical protein QJS10_CPB18g01810 [Acorus calamus]
MDPLDDDLQDPNEGAFVGEAPSEEMRNLVYERTSVYRIEGEFPKHLHYKIIYGIKFYVDEILNVRDSKSLTVDEVLEWIDKVEDDVILQIMKFRGFDALLCYYQVPELITYQPKLKGINILELKGILEGIKLAARRHSSRLWIEGDSQTAICWVNGRGSPPWQAIRTLAAIKHLLPLFLEWKASHIGREASCPADLLASWRKQDGEEYVQLEHLGNDLQTALHLDAIGKEYLRIK